MYYKIKDLGAGVTAVHERRGVNDYVIGGEDKVLVIDTGFGCKKFSRIIEKIADGREVVVFNTHWHFDHCKGDKQFGTVLIGEADLPGEGPSVFDELIDGLSASVKYNTHVCKHLADFVVGRLHIDKGNTKFLPVKDGETIDLGGRVVRFLALPGHTFGSMVVVDETTHTAYVGDAVGDYFWFFTNPSMKVSEYVDNLSEFETKILDCDKLRFSHSLEVKDTEFIGAASHLAKSVAAGDAAVTKRFEKAFPEPLCIAAEADEKYGELKFLYFASQL